MNAIKQIRQTLGLKQRELADAVGLFQTAISFYEVGKNDPTPDTARKIVKFARSRGLMIGYEHVYGDEPVPELQPELATANTEPAAQPAAQTAGA